MKALALAAAVLLAGCTVTPEDQAAACQKARDAARLAEIGLALACTRAGPICDGAGAALKSANDTIRLMCVATAGPRNIVP